MSFYRSILAAFTAAALISPVFADDTTAAQTTNSTAAVQTTDSQNATVEKIDLNKATAKDLMKVKGLNAKKAKAIVAYRKKHGDFKSVEELNQVKGFKAMKSDSLQQIEDQLTIG